MAANSRSRIRQRALDSNSNHEGAGNEYIIERQSWDTLRPERKQARVARVIARVAGQRRRSRSLAPSPSPRNDDIPAILAIPRLLCGDGQPNVASVRCFFSFPVAVMRVRSKRCDLRNAPYRGADGRVFPYMVRRPNTPGHPHLWTTAEKLEAPSLNTISSSVRNIPLISPSVISWFFRQMIFFFSAPDGRMPPPKPANRAQLALFPTAAASRFIPRSSCPPAAPDLA